MEGMVGKFSVSIHIFHISHTHHILYTHMPFTACISLLPTHHHLLFLSPDTRATLFLSHFHFHPIFFGCYNSFSTFAVSHRKLFFDFSFIISCGYRFIHSVFRFEIKCVRIVLHIPAFFIQFVRIFYRVLAILSMPWALFL